MKFRRVMLTTLTAVSILAVSSVRSYGNRITVNTDTLRLSAGPGDTAVAYLHISDGRDTSLGVPAHLTRLGFQTYGNSGIKFAGSSTVDFYGSVDIPFIFMGGQSSYGSVTIFGDSNSLSVQLIGTSKSSAGLSLKQPFSAPFLDSLRINHERCLSIQIGAMWDSVTITGIHVDSAHQSSVQFRITGSPVLPHKFGHNATVSFQICALATDAVNQNWLLATLHVDYDSAGVSRTSLWPIYGREVPLDTLCLYLGGGSVNAGTVMEGDSIVKLGLMYNRTDSIVTVDSVTFVSGDRDRFALLSPTPPFTVPPHAYDTLRFQYSVPNPSFPDKYSESLVIWPRGTSLDNVTCGAYPIIVFGSVGIPLVDTIILSVPGGDTTTIQLSSTHIRSKHALDIHNVGSTRVVIQQIQILDTTGIAWFNSPTQRIINRRDTLSTGQDAWATMTLSVSDTVTHDVNLQVNYVNALTSQIFRIRVRNNVQLPLKVERTPHQLDFSINPNPARDEVTISLPTNGQSTVEIYDVLGNLLLHKQATGAMAWNGRDMQGRETHSASYIVRVTERNLDGTTTSSSKRLVFMR